MNEPPGCAKSSFHKNSRADNRPQDRAPGCALRGASRGSVLGLFLVVSNRARSGWSMRATRRVKISMHNVWRGVSERQSIHLALIFSLSHIFFASVMLILFDIHLPLPNDFKHSRLAGEVFTRLVALIDHPERTRFSSFPKSPIFMQFEGVFIHLLQGVGPGMLREARIPGPTPWSISNNVFYSW